MRGASAAWPVSARNTSSRSADSTVRPIDAASSRPVEHAAQPGDAAVVRDLQGERLDVGGRRPGAPPLPRSSAVGVGELHRHVPAGHPPLQLRGGALGDQPATVEDPDPVGELVGLLEVLRGQQHRHAVGDLLAHDRPQVATAARVEAGRRLVEEDQPRAGR